MHALVHTFGGYDVGIDATQPLKDNVDFLLDAWRARAHPGAFEQMLAAERRDGHNAR